MGRIITTPLPKDLPENWNDTQFVSPNGTEVGLSQQHGYNYLMKQVNDAQKAILELDEGSAPAGFGLGQQFANSRITDANLINETGFYACQVNTPDNQWANGVHIQYSPGYAYQRFAKTTSTAVYERWCINSVWSSWERTYSTGFKPTLADVGAEPDGLISGSIATVLSAEDLDTRLTTMFDSMANATIKHVRVTFQVAHPVLGGGDRFFEIFRANTNYGTVRAVGYASSETGAFLEHRRSFYNRVWTTWSKVGGTNVVPASIE